MIKKDFGIVDGKLYYKLSTTVNGVDFYQQVTINTMFDGGPAEQVLRDLRRKLERSINEHLFKGSNIP